MDGTTALIFSAIAILVILAINMYIPIGEHIPFLVGLAVVVFVIVWAILTYFHIVIPGV